MSGGRVLFSVQHLRGIGHLKRAAVLARAFAQAGIDVDFVSGGMAVPDLDIGAARFFQLPPVRSPDDTYSKLVDEKGSPVGPGLHARRRDLLLEIFRAGRADAVIVEMFPFGRSQIRSEIIALLEAARDRRPRPCAISSVRDVLPAKRTPERYEEIADEAQAYLDYVMVHGDPALIPFEASFPPARRLEGMLHYTGYVVNGGPRAERRAEACPQGQSTAGTGEVVVSAGGGAFGQDLLDAALKARALSRHASRTWRLITGPNLEDAQFRALERAAPDGVVIERMRRDFPQLIARCAVSVSQGGYNTVMDILRSSARAVLVPFASGRQTEQALRAEYLARRGAVKVLPQAELTPAALASAIDAAAAGPPAAAAGVNLEGAATTTRLVKGWLRKGCGR
ncbi:MAG: glycosyltransferase [Alphaproteobacteria bacterium]